MRNRIKRGDRGMKSVLFLCVFILSLCFSSYAQIVLNEILPSNASVTVDEDDAYEDLIELYNAGDEPAGLGGYGLSDNAAQPFKWIFPDTVLAPGEFLLVWASGKNRSLPGNGLHASFSISAAGEEILLTSPDSSLVDFIPPTPLPADISYGRQPDGDDIWFFFSEPTPGASNTGTGYLGIAAPPGPSHNSGFYTDSLSLRFDSEDGSVVYYTSDGSEPTDSSTVYTDPLLIEDRSQHPNVLSEIPTNVSYNWVSPGEVIKKGTVIRARTIRDGYLPSEIVTRTFIIDETGRARYSFPVLSLVTDSLHLFDHETGIYVPGVNSVVNPQAPWHQQGNFTMRGIEWERPVHIELIETDGTIPLSEQAGMRIHGGASRSLPQKALRLYARGEYGGSWFNYQFFPDKTIDRYKRIVLRNSGNDWTSILFRDAFIHKLLDGVDLDHLSSRPAIVFINGEYWGIHNIRDRVDKYYLETHHIVDPESVDLLSGNSEVIEGDPWHYTAMLDYIKSTNLTDPEHLQVLRTLMDVDNHLTYVAFNVYIGNTDWPGNNIDYWRPRIPGGKWRWIVYDTDFGFGLFDGIHAHTLNTLAMAMDENGLGWPNPPWSTLIFRKLMNNQDAREYFISRIADLMNTIFVSDLVVRLLNEMETEYEPEIMEHFRRWIPFRSIFGWRGDVEQLRTYATQRADEVRMHVVGQFELPGTGVVTIDTGERNAGIVRINSVRIDRDLPGIIDPNQPYPWSGTYFQGVPIRLIAEPLTGYSFAGWNGQSHLSDTLLVTISGDTTLMAHFILSENFEGDKINPPAYELSSGPYLFEYWDEQEIEGSFPPGMIFQQSSVNDPGLSEEMTDPYHIPHIDENENEYHADDQDKVGFPYKLTGRTRLNGLGHQGISLINTGRGRDLGAVVLALNTLGLEDIYVSFLAGTILPNNREYALRLQYRIGIQEAFRDVHGEGAPVEYKRNEQAGHAQIIGPVRLPDEIQDKPYVQLRWKFYHLAGTSGSRAMLRLDNIAVTVGPPEDPMNPEPHMLADGPYSFTVWNDNQPEGAFPPHMVFQQSSIDDPGLHDEMTTPYHIPYIDDENNDYHANDQDKIRYPYKLTGRTRLNALGDDGIGFINTGRGRDLGAAVLALNTTGMTNVNVSWTGGTLIPSSRVYRIRMQYRIGTDGEFSDVLLNGMPVEYVRSAETGHHENLGPIRLPDVVNNKAYVQIRWKYYFTGVRLDPEVGSRDMLRLGDISVTGIPVGVEIPVEKPATFQLYQNYPNPFNPLTVVTFAVPEPSRVRIEIYNMIGQRLAVLFNRDVEAGIHSTEWNTTGSGLSSGIYIYKMEAQPLDQSIPGFSRLRSMVYIK